MVYLLVLNATGSQEFPMINTLGSLNSLVYYSTESFCKLVLMLIQRTLRSRSPSEFTTGELRLAGVFITGESFWTPGSHFTNFKENTTIFKGSINIKLTVGYFNYLGTCDLCLQKLHNLRDSNRFPSVFTAGESIKNTKGVDYE